jgi:hypothetical protein
VFLVPQLLGETAQPEAFFMTLRANGFTQPVNVCATQPRPASLAPEFTFMNNFMVFKNGYLNFIG